MPSSTKDDLGTGANRCHGIYRLTNLSVEVVKLCKLKFSSQLSSENTIVLPSFNVIGKLVSLYDKKCSFNNRSLDAVYYLFCGRRKHGRVRGTPASMTGVINVLIWFHVKITFISRRLKDRSKYKGKQ